MNGRIRFLLAASFASATASGAGEAVRVEEIAGYVRVNEVVATGGQPTMPQVLALGAAGFRAILNLREDGEFDSAAEAEAAREAGLIYLRVPVKGSDPNDKEVGEFLRMTDDPANYPVFIHCASGNRVGAFLLIRWVLRDGRTFDEAEGEAVRIGLKSPNLKVFARTYLEAHPAVTSR